MMSRKYAVLLNAGHGLPALLVDDHEDAELYTNRAEATKAAELNPLGQARGYSIIPWNYYEG
jgi:hypothetical protein